MSEFPFTTWASVGTSFACGELAASHRLLLLAAPVPSRWEVSWQRLCLPSLQELPSLRAGYRTASELLARMLSSASMNQSIRLLDCDKLEALPANAERRMLLSFNA